VDKQLAEGTADMVEDVDIVGMVVDMVGMIEDM